MGLKHISRNRVNGEASIWINNQRSSWTLVQYRLSRMPALGHKWTFRGEGDLPIQEVMALNAETVSAPGISSAVDVLRADDVIE